MIHQFDHGDGRTQRVIDGGHFQPDNPATHNQQSLGDVGQFQRAGGIDQAWIIVREAGNLDRLRTDGNDRMLEGDRLFAVARGNRQRLVRGKAADALHHGDTALLGHRGQSQRQRLHNLVLVVAHLVQVNLGWSELDTGTGAFSRFVDDLGGMQQRLGGNTADVQTYTAERRVALDQHDLLAEISGAKGRGITAGTASENEDFGVQGRVFAHNGES